MKRVAVIPHAGLCNRMRAIASAIRIARKFEAEVVIYWNHTWDCSAHFYDLFEEIGLKGVRLVENKSLMHKVKMRKHFKIPYFMQKLYYNQVIYDFDRNKKGDIFPLLHFKKNLLLHSCYIMCDYDALGTIFKPSRTVQNELDKVTAGFTSKTVGVHVRGTDHTLAKTNSTLERFITQMQQAIELDGEVNFYLATDEQEVKEVMQQRFGHRILTHPTVLNRNSLEGMIGGMVDLFALSKTSYIIGSYGSSYSEVAAELGGVNLVIAK
ncbi:MAG: hypothetical protein J6Q57_01565 [Paraprevotella sp.]|nr:hypothetical protein [Paraprevotella sp.]